MDISWKWWGINQADEGKISTGAVTIECKFKKKKNLIFGLIVFLL